MDAHTSPPLSAATDAQGRLILPKEALEFEPEQGSTFPLEIRREGMLLRWPLSQLRKIYIEPTSRCNFSCRTCMRNAWNEPLGHMSRETFEHLIEGLAVEPKGGASLFFGGFGEPLLHPRIIEMVEASRRISSRVEMITNGSLLHADVATGLITAGLSTLWVSIDGATAEGYEDVRGSDTFENVLTNIASYRELYRDLQHSEPDIGVVFVAMKRNIQQFSDLIRRGRRLGIRQYMLTNILPYSAEMCGEVLYQRSLDRWDGKPSPWNPHIHMPRIDMTDVTSETLFDIWNTRPGGWSDRQDRCPFIEQRSTIVAWDGNVSPCLAMLHSHESYLHEKARTVERYKLGNVNERSLLEIWQSEQYKLFREKVDQFDFAPCTLCGGCEMAEGNQEDCFGNTFPTCGGCLWARGVIQCP